MAQTIPFPSTMAPSQMTETLRSNTRMYRSPVSGVPVTVENPGAHWMFSMDYNSLNNGDAYSDLILQSLSKMRGFAKRMHIHHLGKPETSGTLDVTNLVSNYNFLLGNTSWSDTPGTGGRITYSGGLVRLQRGTSNCTVSQAGIAMSAGKTYSAHIAIHSGDATTVRVAVGGATLDFSGEGRHVATFTASGTTGITISNQNNNTFVSVSDVIVARAATSDGVDQAGSVINIQGLETSEENVVKPMDFVSINGELKQVVDVLVSDASGNGKLVIEPPMHALVPDNSDVIFNRPFGKFIMEEDSFSKTITPPYLTNFSVNFVEDLS